LEGDTMTPNDWLTEQHKLQDRIERADKLASDAHEVERRAAAVLDQATADADAAADDPHSFGRAKAKLTEVQAAHDAARQERERRESLRRVARRALSEHEATARAVLESGVADLRRAAFSHQVALDNEWRAAADQLLAVAAKAAALQRTAAGSVRAHDGINLPLMGEGLDRTLDALMVPVIGTGGSGPSDRLVDGDKVRAIAPVHRDTYSDLAAQRAILDALADVIRRVAEREHVKAA
jgi:hypothetical protein